MDLTDEQWEVLEEPLIAPPPRRADGRGRPWRDPRDVLNGILWILRTGAPWYDLPECYPPYQTCHRRFQKWVEEGTLSGILEALALDLKESAEGWISPSALSMAPSLWPKRGSLGGKDQAGQRYEELMAVADGSSLPLAVHAASASPHESSPFLKRLSASALSRSVLRS